MRRGGWKSIFQSHFFKICILHLATKIYCCTTILVYKLSIQKKSKVVPYMFMVSLFTQVHIQLYHHAIITLPDVPEHYTVVDSILQSLSPPPMQVHTHMRACRQCRASSFPVLLHFHMTFRSLFKACNLKQNFML